MLHNDSQTLLLQVLMMMLRGFFSRALVEFTGCRGEKLLLLLEELLLRQTALVHFAGFLLSGLFRLVGSAFDLSTETFPFLYGSAFLHFPPVRRKEKDNHLERLLHLPRTR